MKNAPCLLVATLITLLNFSALGQVDVLTHNRANTFYVGWNGGTAGPLDIRNNYTGPGFPIDFYTSNNQVGTITPVGFHGIGSATLGTNFGTFPNHWLDVDIGDINVHQLNHGYRIGGSDTSVGSNFVLWHGTNGDIRNISPSLVLGE